MIAALGKMDEFQTHVRGALGNGLTPNEVRAVLTQIAVYCGIPVGVPPTTLPLRGRDGVRGQPSISYGCLAVGR